MNSGNYSLSANSWMRASDLKLIYQSDYPVFLGGAAAYAFFGVLGAGCIIGGATCRLCNFKLKEDVASACGAIAAATVIVSTPIIYCVNSYFQEKNYDNNKNLLNNYSWYEIVPSSVLYKFVSGCSSKMQSIIIKKLNSVQLEGIKNECTKQHKPQNACLLSLIERYAQEAFRVDIPEDEAIMHEQNLIPSLLKEVMVALDYSDTLKECIIIYGDSVQENILKELNLVTLFTSEDKTAQKNFISFVKNNNFKRVKVKIEKAFCTILAQEIIKKIEEIK